MRSVQIIHHNDFDGIAAAGVMVIFLGEYYREPLDFHYRAIDYDEVQTWLAEEFTMETVVVDFPLHHQAQWWFDHHDTSFIAADSRSWYDAGAQMLWDPKAHSCPGLLFRFFRQHHPQFYASHLDRFQVLIQKADVIDAALYESVHQIYDFDDPYMAFNRMLADRRDHAIRAGFLAALIENRLESFFTSEDFHIRQLGMKDKLHQLELYVRDHLTLHGGVAVVDYLESTLGVEPYLQYLIHPEIRFTITLSRRDEGYHLGLGRNPWMEDSPINLGNYLKGFGGGGRQNVGAVICPDESTMKQVAHQVLNTLVPLDRDSRAPDETILRVI